MVGIRAREALQLAKSTLRVAALFGCISLFGCQNPHGLDSRVVPHPYLNMPQTADGTMPALLSQTGALKDPRTLTPSDGLIEYEIRVPFWSDGAQKRRWIAVPASKIEFSPEGEWTFPSGVVFVKTFELPVDDTRPSVKRRLETRLLVRDRAGGVYGGRLQVES